MNELARLFLDTMWLKREESRSEEPSDRSQLPMIDCMTSIG